eukprot:gnl/MRDRNA2_/MRDRNA2_44977_c0_seq1.p1 gnl/MRDRNA2_/MRDRNA2_44977_c0~~gnl/MRDRNA2_/MRDRNA2_44977_c0_seq1.p1  ORF type:complete len:327 (+),score=87.67 gnl/MRDRNA2_/MRDRNA2_44977_c0_seq1:87-1067(+)
MLRAILLVVLGAQVSAIQSDKFLQVKEDAVHIAEWWGRLGNNLLQLQNALIYAEAKGKTKVTFPTAHGTELKQLITLPETGIKVDPKNMEKKETCLRKPPFFYDDFFHNSGRAGCFSDIAVRRRVMVQYVKPLLQHPNDDNKVSEDELLIHLRSGDMMRPGGISHPQTRQPPCAAYDKIIEEGNDGAAFQNVRIIGEHDHRNPCFDELVKRHPDKNVTVQEKSFIDDAAALINARNLALGTSSFSLMLGLFNEHLERAWAAQQTITKEIVGCGYAKKVNLMNIPGLEKIREYDDRRTWMRSFKAKQITIKPMCSKNDAPEVVLKQN